MIIEYQMRKKPSFRHPDDRWVTFCGEFNTQADFDLFVKKEGFRDNEIRNVKEVKENYDAV